MGFKILWSLFFSFFKVSIFTFGGGYAMIPLLRSEMIERRGWITEQDLLDYYVIAQCTPGIIGVNVATFVGHKTAGKTGACIATFGIIAPSLLLVSLVSLFLLPYIELPVVQHAISGAKLGAIALIVSTVVDLWGKSVKGKWGAAVFILSFAGAFGLDVGTAPIFILAAAAGYVRGRIVQKKEGHNG